MRILRLIPLFILLLSSCGKEISLKDIYALEKAVATQPDSANTAALLQLYTDYAAQHPATRESATFLTRAAWLTQKIRGSKSQDLILQALKLDPKLLPDSAITLAARYAGQAIAQPNGFKTWSSALTPFQARLEKIRASLSVQPPFDPVTGVPDTLLAYTYAGLAMQMSTNKSDSLSAHHLFQAAQALRNGKNYLTAMQLLDLVEKDFPNYNKMNMVYFMRAFIYDNDLQDYDKARVAYQAFLDKYPKDELADDTRLILQNLGRAPEELIGKK